MDEIKGKFFISDDTGEISVESLDEDVAKLVICDLINHIEYLEGKVRGDAARRIVYGGSSDGPDTLTVYLGNEL